MVVEFDGFPGQLSPTSIVLQEQNFKQMSACAVSGARTFMNRERIAAEGMSWIASQVARYIEVIREAKKNLPELP